MGTARVWLVPCFTSVKKYSRAWVPMKSRFGSVLSCLYHLTCNINLMLLFYLSLLSCFMGSKSDINNAILLAWNAVGFFTILRSHILLINLVLLSSGFQIAYSLLEEQEGQARRPNDYISFVSLLADPRYCGTHLFLSAVTMELHVSGQCIFLFSFVHK